MDFGLAPNLALFAAAFCVLHTHAKQGSNSESLPSRGAKFGPAFCTREPVLDPHVFPTLPSRPAHFCVQRQPHEPDLYQGHNPSPGQDGLSFIAFPDFLQRSI
jgi:hypothetical protein